MSDICCIFNYGPHYREAIYKLMDKEIGCDFWIGDRTDTSIKAMNYNSLKGFCGLLKYKPLRVFYRLVGTHNVVINHKYKKYIAIGEPFCLSIWFVLIWSKITMKKVVLWSHGINDDIPKWKTRIFHKFFWSLPSHIMLYGNYSKDFMVKFGIPENKMSVIYNSLDYDRQLPIRQSLHKTDIYKSHFGNDYPVLLYIGRIQKRKKIDMVIEAMHILDQQDIKVNFVCIGDNNEDSGIKPLIEKYSLGDRVWIYGPLYDEEKKGEMLYNADVCVTPGNVGLTAMDCLMYGCPIITNDDFTRQMPEFEAIEDGVTGAFFKNDDIQSLATTIHLWIENHKDRTEVMENGFRVIDEKYNPHYQIGVIKKALNLK